MMRTSPSSGARGFTLLELLVTVAVAAVLMSLAVPSMRELIALQRLKSINAELVTDLQYARSEAVSRNSTLLWVKFMTSANPPMSCYVVYSATAFGNCDCTLAPGSVCTGGREEIRTTRIPASTDVQVLPVSSPPPAEVRFGNDGMRLGSADFAISTTRISGSPGKLKVTVSATGRPTVCSPDQSISGVPGPC